MKICDLLLFSKIYIYRLFIENDLKVRGRRKFLRNCGLY